MPTIRPAPAACGRCAWRPRPEVLLLLLSLAGTVGAKLLALRRQQPDHLVADMVGAVLADLTFFAGVALVLAVLLAVWRSRWAARLAVLVALVLAAWSVLNAAWLVATGVQLQPSVLEVAVADARESRDIIIEYAGRNAAKVAALGALLLLCGAWTAWRLVRPRAVPASPGPHVRRVALWGAVLVVSALGQVLDIGGSRVSSWGQAVGFSSHWFALIHVVSDVTDPADAVTAGRVLPRAGERAIGRPAGGERPNVVLIFLESVSYPACSLGGPPTTPTLAQLATEGVEFRATRVPVALTSKAWWSGLTGTTPDLQLRSPRRSVAANDSVEAVLVDHPYENLATILGRDGYRSAFFEMSKGTWEGGPAFFANLGFDWAWFRENLEDESANLGWMNGDDMRMLDPMFEWVDGGDEPFLLSMITSVSHEPYVLPAWYAEPPAEDAYHRYLQTVTCGDLFVAAVLERLEERGLLDDSLVCVIGDHGESFRPEARRARWAPLEEVIRVPWVVRWPGHVEAGRVVDWPCSQLDLTPTLLSLLGYDVTEAGFDGRDATTPAPADRRLYYSSWYRGSPLGYLEGDRKYIYWPYTDTLFAYDLRTDPGERTPEEVTGPEKDEVVAALTAWEHGSYLEFPARRFREARLYDHWQAMSQGRTTSVYYVPDAGSSP